MCIRIADGIRWRRLAEIRVQVELVFGSSLLSGLFLIDMLVVRFAFPVFEVDVDMRLERLFADLDRQVPVQEALVEHLVHKGLVNQFESG